MATKAKKKKTRSSSKKSKPTILRVGFIGAGGIAGTHMRYLKEMADVQLVAASDVSAAALDSVKANHGVETVYEDWKAMLAAEKLDAVSVCTPNGLHAPATIDALNAGCHVLVEKPLAMDAKEGRKMIAAAEANDRKLIIAFQWRFHATTQMLRRASAAGIFGKILYTRCQALRRRGIPNWGVFGRKDLQGGGPLIDIGVHNMEMAHYVMGSPEPVSAAGSIYTYMGNKPCAADCSWPDWDHKTYTVEDLAVGHIRFANGATMHLEASFAMHGENEWNFTFMGEKGGGQFAPAKIYRDEAGTMFDCTPAFEAKTDMFAIKMRNFVDTVLYNKPTEAPAEAGLMVQKMIDGIYRSAEKGREVKIT